MCVARGLASHRVFGWGLGWDGMGRSEPAPAAIWMGSLPPQKYEFAPRSRSRPSPVYLPSISLAITELAPVRAVAVEEHAPKSLSPELATAVELVPGLVELVRAPGSAD
jgi:hypothetical protein